MSDPYAATFAGRRIDPYRVCVLFEINHPALQQIVKKVLRCGKKHKTAEEDVRDIISSAQRFLAMQAEDASIADQ